MVNLFFRANFCLFKINICFILFFLTFNNENQMLNNQYITQLINLKGVIFKDLYFKDDTLRIFVASQHKAGICPHCCKPSNKLIDVTPKTFRDCNFGDRLCFIEMDHRRFECRQCYKSFMEEFSFIRPYRHYTNRFEQQVYECCKETTTSYTAKKFSLCESTVMNIYKHIALDNQMKLSLENPTTIIGFDEISMHKGHKDFVLVITDISNKRVLDILPDRKKETLRAYLSSWSEEKKKLITGVAIDLWGPYRSIAEEFFSQAVITADRFHVMQNLNRCLDTCRKEEKKSSIKMEMFLEKMQNLHC